MDKMIFITGGARSGKSRYAEERAKEMARETVYIATGIAFDEGMQARIAHHRAQRPAEWQTIERYREFGKLAEDPVFQTAEVVLLDCMTVLITNLMLDETLDYDNCSMAEVEGVEGRVRHQLQTMLEMMEGKTLILVANEVGLGLVPSYKLGSYFRDIAGRMNQYMAREADEVYFTVSGIPMQLK